MTLNNRYAFRISFYAMQYSVHYFAHRYLPCLTDIHEFPIALNKEVKAIRF